MVYSISSSKMYNWIKYLKFWKVLKRQFIVFSYISILQSKK